ncbi:hypothetical protein E2C01_048828 [Portunus trituberculatus]|uniref:Uncharacterized protein n=1 Tax=Portunus trituberculatus TaxID=210409 RepID=A0A5B7GB73_PORTR|nr:hypothetical protein [Portunus trituberculatus]
MKTPLTVIAHPLLPHPVHSHTPPPFIPTAADVTEERRGEEDHHTLPCPSLLWHNLANPVQVRRVALVDLKEEGGMNYSAGLTQLNRVLWRIYWGFQRWFLWF